MCNYKSVCTHTYTVYIYIFVYSVYIKYIALYSTAELCYCFNMFLKDLEDKTCHVLRFDQAKHVTLLCRSHFDLKRDWRGHNWASVWRSAPQFRLYRHRPPT